MMGVPFRVFAIFIHLAPRHAHVIVWRHFRQVEGGWRREMKQGLLKSRALCCGVCSLGCATLLAPPPQRNADTDSAHTHARPGDAPRDC
uniref:Putative secreted protein n=1 Tax=Anopheles triannulatus TaxID=58253 RepID=A0A2M4B7D3_9DIPT